MEQAPTAAWSSQQRADPCLEFGHREGLRQVIVRTEIEAVDAVLDRIARGQHQHVVAARRRADDAALRSRRCRAARYRAPPGRSSLGRAAGRRIAAGLVTAWPARASTLTSPSASSASSSTTRMRIADVLSRYRRPASMVDAASHGPRRRLELVSCPNGKPCGRSRSGGLSRLCAYQPDSPPTAQPASTSDCQCAWFLIRAGADVQRQQQQRVGRRIVAGVLDHIGRDERRGRPPLRRSESCGWSCPGTTGRDCPWCSAAPRIYTCPLADVADDLGVDALPHRLAEAGLRALPYRAADLGDRQPPTIPR